MLHAAMEPPAAGPLFAEFPDVSDAEWRRVAEEALEGAPFEKKLVTRTPEGIDLQPIYSRTAEASWDPPASGGELPPFLRGAERRGPRPSAWLICQAIPGETPAAFNAALRDALDRGQNAVVLTEAQGWTRDSELATALAEVDLTAVPLIAHVRSEGSAFARALFAWATSAGVSARALHGGILSDPLSSWVQHGGLSRAWEHCLDEMADVTQQVARRGSPLRTIGVDGAIWTDAGANAVQELAFALATAVEYSRALAARGVNHDAAAARTLFTFGLGSHFFMQVAKLRAARLLWARAMEAAGGSEQAQRLVCHGRTTLWNKSALDPHVNLLRTTAESFAGVMGGVAGLQIAPFDCCSERSGPLAERLARNLPIILAEECQLARVADPAGGSWFVETLTRELATKAWTLFQEIEALGGMAAALRLGHPQAVILQNATGQIEAVESRREGLIGVNLHPNLREQVSAHPRRSAPRPAAPVAPITPVAPRRRAEPFEELRRRLAVFTDRTGQRPTVFLAKLGPRKQHAARAEFSAAFFAAGGFEVPVSAACDAVPAAVAAARAAHASIVVICSTDDTHPQIVPAFARAVKSAHPAPLIVLAGWPATPELQAQFRTAGVDEFIHLRANCAHLLAGFMDRLGF
ncbi:MAG: methylmalonyl-CoA mutase [Opitutus sp.]|nr:methylmalonyl-CoA mutase [Opitutus sp.]